MYHNVCQNCQSFVHTKTGALNKQDVTVNHCLSCLTSAPHFKLATDCYVMFLLIAVPLCQLEIYLCGQKVTVLAFVIPAIFTTIHVLAVRYTSHIYIGKLVALP